MNQSISQKVSKDKSETGLTNLIKKVVVDVSFCFLLRKQKRWTSDPWIIDTKTGLRDCRIVFTIKVIKGHIARY